MNTRKALHIAALACSAMLVLGHPGSGFAATGNGDDLMVRFSIGWDDAWRGSPGEINDDRQQPTEGWDAAWLFVKLRVGDGPWQHARLNETGHIHPEAVTLDPGMLKPGQDYHPDNNPIVGYFVYRGDTGFGDFSAEGIQLSMSCLANGIPEGGSYEVRLFAIGMEYIPAQGQGTQYTAPFYLMKSGITNQQYVDFLNTLSLEEQQAHTGASPFAEEGTPVWASPEDHEPGAGVQLVFPAYEYENRVFPAEYMTNDPWKACEHIGPSSAMAFLEWSGQRPPSRQEISSAATWRTFRSEREKRLGESKILVGSLPDQGLEVGYRGARSSTPVQSHMVQQDNRAQGTP
jgi:hypothetical protein